MQQESIDIVARLSGIKLSEANEPVEPELEPNEPEPELEADSYIEEGDMNA